MMDKPCSLTHYLPKTVQIVRPYMNTEKNKTHNFHIYLSKFVLHVCTWEYLEWLHISIFTKHLSFISPNICKLFQKHEKEMRLVLFVALIAGKEQEGIYP